MYGVKAKDIVGYTVMPRIVPRVREIFTSGFGYVAFLMANIYHMVRLLPPAHAYLNPANIGKFGIRHVIAEAANHLVLKKENLDQVVVFAALLAGAVLLILQFVLLLGSLFVHQANAFGLFETAFPERDIAFMMLDHVFGVPGLFNSCVATGGICTPGGPNMPPFPYPFHFALHELFRFYSIGLLFVGILIFLYFVVVVVIETAVSGSPFGQRFANIWVPIRLVVALALLVPVNFGLNSAQYITLYAAKLGSGFATNRWLDYNAAVASDPDGSALGPNPLGERLSLIAYPESPDASPIVAMMSLVHACAYAYWRLSGAPDSPAGIHSAAAPVRPYYVKIPQPNGDPREWEEITPANMSSFDNALRFYDYGDVIIRFGQRNPNLYGNEKGDVKSLCGDIRIRINSVFNLATGGWASAQANGGPEYMFGSYFYQLTQAWFDEENFRQFALRMIELNMNFGDSVEPLMPVRQCNEVAGAPDAGCGGGSNLPACDMGGITYDEPCRTQAPGAEWKEMMNERYQTELEFALAIAWENYVTTGAEYDMTAEVLERGWGGAGIWYNKVAQFNGAFISSVLDFPAMDVYPLVMEQVREERRKQDKDVGPMIQFNPNLSSSSDTENKVVIDGGEEAVAMAKALNAVYEYAFRDGLSQMDQEKVLSSNILVDGMNILFGTKGLMDIRNENAHTHPLASLVAVGKSLVESAIRNIGYGGALAFLGGLAGAIDKSGATGPALMAISGMLTSITFLGLTVGIVLFYVLPFLPFVYFYFSVANWVKTIFEAMVGTPLWALAHLRLDGNGLPGDSASNGYFLIFEVFVRPVLTVFGLIAALTIFAAQVRILNFLWDLVTQNLTGFTDPGPSIAIAADISVKRGPIDQFFFTIIYTIVVYMLATSCFKLIDRIPQHILRWMGTGVSAYGDINQEPVESIGRYVSTSGLVFGEQIAGGVTGLARGAGSGIGGALSGMTRGGGGGTPRASDIRLKENIEYLGLENGFPVYAFNYIGRPQRYKGVMAQDILEIMPEAVTEIDGYLAVYYDRLGISMEEIN